MKALLMALLLSITAPKLPCEVWMAQQRYDFIEEHNLKRVKVSCYTAPEGAHTADGSVPIEGMVSSNREHMGMDCIVYDSNLVAVMRLECRDVGGHPMLQDGTAIDIFRSSEERCWQLIGEYGTHVWVEWIDREETEDGQGD